MRTPTIAITALGAASAVAIYAIRRRSRLLSAERFAAAALETVLNAIDANDSQTGAHARRVATYSLILAEAAGFDERDQRSVERVALFHDVGKIHEALFDIIHDEQKLTRRERREIATHPARGARVLAPLNGFYPELSESVLSHHERWDGKGYPRKLKGNEIPVSARIVAITDTFDAITHHRRYRDGRSALIARDVILQGRGTQFDPELVDLFVFPPVFERTVAAERAATHWKTPVHSRRAGLQEEQVPDITFRWRPGRSGARGLPASDQPRKTAR